MRPASRRVWFILATAAFWSKLACWALIAAAHILLSAAWALGTLIG